MKFITKNKRRDEMKHVETRKSEMMFLVSYLKIKQCSLF